MSFPVIYRAIRAITLETVLETATARAIARKAGIRSVGSVLGESADIWSTFSAANDSSGAGYVSEYVSGEEAYYFPDDTEKMSVFSDMTNATYSRLLVWVTQAGVADSSIGIASDQITFASSIQLPLDVVGVHVSPWAAMTIMGPAELTEVYGRWVVGNPTLAEGSFGVGLMQWQVR